jgi:hypothetical protein
MTIQRTLAVLWIGFFIAGLSYWLWMFLNKSAPAYDGIHALQSPLLLFGIVACIFLFKGANWARISMGCIAIVSRSAYLSGKFCLRIGCGRISGEMMPGSFFHWRRLCFCFLSSRAKPCLKSPIIRLIHFLTSRIIRTTFIFPGQVGIKRQSQPGAGAPGPIIYSTAAPQSLASNHRAIRRAQSPCRRVAARAPDASRPRS